MRLHLGARVRNKLQVRESFVPKAALRKTRDKRLRHVTRDCSICASACVLPQAAALYNMFRLQLGQHLLQ
jgi:hypothetical protein